jgi:hypothetical protein
MLENKIAFTTTSLSRPDILEQTYESFTKNIEGIEFSKCKLFINIDPVPINELQQDTLSVAKKYFNNVKWNITKEPHFTKAVNWCWSNADTPFIFHLEDDWLLLKKINIRDLIDKKDALHIILRAYDYDYNWPVLSPGIWKDSLYKTFAGNLNVNMNPEVQLKNKAFKYDRSKIMVVGENVIVEDIGRSWLVEKGLEKPDKSKFIRY